MKKEDLDKYFPIKDSSDFSFDWIDEPGLRKKLEEAQDKVGGAIPLSSRCANCHKQIDEDEEIYGVLMVASRDVSHLAGVFIPIRTIDGKVFPAFVTTNDSEAKEERY